MTLLWVSIAALLVAAILVNIALYWGDGKSMLAGLACCMLVAIAIPSTEWVVTSQASETTHVAETQIANIAASNKSPLYVYDTSYLVVNQYELYYLSEGELVRLVLTSNDSPIEIKFYDGPGIVRHYFNRFDNPSVYDWILPFGDHYSNDRYEIWIPSGSIQRVDNSYG